MKNALLRFSLGHPWWVIGLSALVTFGLSAQLPRVQIDTDPENMLPADEAVRVHHDEIQEAFTLYDYLVVGIVREAPGGAFRPETLERALLIAEHARDLEGVIEDDILAPSEVDDIYTTEDGILRVDTLMEEAPGDLAGAERILLRIQDNPVLRGTLASEDGKAVALFIPLESKEHAHEVGAELQAFIDELGGDEEYYLAGIPIAEDTFGMQMFVQMAFGGPAAFALIFFLMLFFFRSPLLVLAPMLLAMMSVLWTMGLLTGLGFTVHIMSSMIPVFLIPIAVLDAIHLLSEFHDRYPRSRDRIRALRETMDELFVPMGYTTITTMVGFASLLLTPIPPVQVFGAFVSFGIGAAWLLTMTFLVAYARLVPEKALEKFARTQEHDFVGERPLRWLRGLALGRGRALVVLGLVVFLVSAVGLTRIEVNDNPVNWFRSDHPLRVADRVLNDHLAGTYLAYLTLEAGEEDAFKNPDVMRYVDRLQRHVEEHPNVGSTTSITDILKKVRRELQGDPAAGILPDSSEEIAQYLFLYEISGGDPEDLFRLITPESDRVNLWIQMREGDNREVAGVVAHANELFADAPDGISVTWAGLPYINVVWQQKMVAGMGKALAGSFVIVLLMMTWLFRSIRLALLSMVPLTATIVLVYGFIGWIGKPYDMPIAVLSSLSLGLSIDFAIHFLQRSREAYERTGRLAGALDEVFGPPARAILRNVIVIALGFVPMFFANLTPYVTVAIFFFAIMLISGFTTLLSLPATMSTFGAGYLPRKGAPTMSTAKAAAVGLGILAFGTLAIPAQAESPDAEALMREAHLNMYYAADDGRAVVEMELVDKKGKSRTRRFVMLRLDEEDGGTQKYYTYFFEPNDVRRTTFLVWKDPVEDDSRWIYIPAVDLVKRISANDKGSSFVGSDFSYEDVSGRHWNDDVHEYVGQEETAGRTAHVVRSVPKEKDSFAEKKTWIGVDEKLPLREEYYDKKGNLVRVFLAEEIREIDGWQTITVRSMENVKKKHKTTVTFSDVTYDVGVEDDLFTERNLKNPPKDLRSL